MLRRAGGWLSPEGDLSTRTVRSGVWETGMNVGTRLLQLVSILVLARLLSPRDFGLMGIVLLTVAALNRFSRLGVNQALIQHEDDDVDQYLDTAWGIQLVRGVLIAGLLVAGAPLIATVFGEPRVTPLVRLVAISPLLLAVRNPGIVYFEKSLNFHLKFRYRLAGSLVETAVAVGYALVSPDVLALVYSYLAADATRAVLSYVLHDYRPRPTLDLAQARELLGYGKWITANNVITFLLEEGDDAVVGWALSASALGFYRIAYRVGTAPATEVTRTISNVVFSAYSKLQDDAERLRRTFLRTLRLIGVAAFPMAVGIVVVAPVFVETVLGEEWLPAVTVMQLLTIYGAVTALTVVFGQLWKAIGRPGLVAKVSVLRLGLLGVAIYPAAVRFGVEGVAAAVVGANLLAVPIAFHVSKRIIDFHYRDAARELGYPVVASLVMGAAVFAVRRGYQPAFRPLELVVLIGTGVAAYVALLGLFDELFDWGLSRNVRSVLESVRG
jgi:PST family polysaccharide transporter/lipopolysaccharide exporter